MTAIFAGSDPTAVGIYEALRESDRRVPDDISVVGFDDIEARVVLPPLTTAHIFLQEIGKKLAELVSNRNREAGTASATRVDSLSDCAEGIVQAPVSPT